MDIIENDRANSVPGLIWSADPAGEPTLFSQRLLDYSGMRLEELQHRGWETFLHPAERQPLRTRIVLEAADGQAERNFTSGSIPFRKAYLQSLIDVIEDDDTQIRIKGSKDVLE